MDIAIRETRSVAHYLFTSVVLIYPVLLTDCLLTDVFSISDCAASSGGLVSGNELGKKSGSGRGLL